LRCGAIFYDARDEVDRCSETGFVQPERWMHVLNQVAQQMCDNPPRIRIKPGYLRFGRFGRFVPAVSTGDEHDISHHSQKFQVSRPRKWLQQTVQTVQTVRDHAA
jgi:hypothetical protein